MTGGEHGQGSGPLFPHGEKADMEAVAAIWNADNERLGISTRWGAVRVVGTTPWPYTVAELEEAPDA